MTRSALMFALACLAGACGDSPARTPMVCPAARGAGPSASQCGATADFTPVNDYRGPIAAVQLREDAVVLLGGDCTGTLIAAASGPVVLTAGHCVALGGTVLHSGAIFLVHTDAPMGFPWPPRDFPLAQQACDHYLDGAAWDVQPQHAEAATVPALADLHARPEYRKWDASADAFANHAGRSIASDFRASWSRTPKTASAG